MTWGELKRWAEENGLDDDSEINYIDIGPSFLGLELYLAKDGTFRFIGSSSSQNYVEKEA